MIHRLWLTFTILLVAGTIGLSDLATANTLPAPTPSASSAAGKVTHGGNLRSEPVVTPSTIIGTVCPDDEVVFLSGMSTEGGVWYKVRITKIPQNCTAKRVKVDTTGWLHTSLLSAAPSSITIIAATPRPKPTARPRPTAKPAPRPQPTAKPRGNCSPSYPDVCIPPAPPDLDCGDIPYKAFRVLPPDPHKFDRDKDGIGCES